MNNTHGVTPQQRGEKKGPNDATCHLGHGMFYFMSFYLLTDVYFQILFSFPPTTLAIYHHHHTRPLRPPFTTPPTSHYDSLVGFHPRPTCFHQDPCHLPPPPTPPTLYHHQRVVMTRWWASSMTRAPAPTNESQSTHWWVSTHAARLIPPPRHQAPSPTLPAIYHHPCHLPYTTTNESLRLVGGLPPRHEAPAPTHAACHIPPTSQYDSLVGFHHNSGPLHAMRHPSRQILFVV
jgi:hypothetical protein